MFVNHKTVLLFAATGILAAACRKKDHIEAPSPIIYKLSPASAQYGATITMHGRYLSANGTTVKINGTPAEVVAVTDSTIAVKVPKGAGSGTVTLSNGGTTISGPAFTYEYKITVTTVAGKANQSGYANGKGEAALFSSPNGIAVDNNDNVYIVDKQNSCIRKMDAEGNVTLFAGTPGTTGFADAPTGTNAKFYAPEGLCIDKNNNLYLVDANNYRIRKITTSGAVSTIAGNGTIGDADHINALQATIAPSFGITTDPAGNIYFSNGISSVRKIVPGGSISTIAGANQIGYYDGQGSEARFSFLMGLTSDTQGNLYISDRNNFRVRKISPSFYTSTVAGNGSDYAIDAENPLQAGFSQIYGIAMDKKGNILIGEPGDGFLRMITSEGKVITIVKGVANGVKDGDANTASFGSIVGIAVNSKNEVYITDGYHCIRKVVYE